MHIPVSIVGANRRFWFSTLALLEAMQGFECDSCYRDSKAALAGIQASRPELMLMDVARLESSVLECVARARAMLPRLRVLIAVGGPNRHGLRECLLAGVTGYWIRPFSQAEYEQAIRAVANGEISLSPAAAQDMEGTFIHFQKHAKYQLSRREREVMACLLLRNSDKEIADKLGLQSGTVHAHLHRIYARMNVHSRDEAVRKLLGLEKAAKSDQPRNSAR